MGYSVVYDDEEVKTVLAYNENNKNNYDVVSDWKAMEKLKKSF